MRQIGITETYDPCFVPDWETRLLEANIVISKELSDEMVEKLLIVQDRVIFHHTVTGQGGTVLEPNVKTPEFEFSQFEKLVERGFPISHYVLRLDPIILFNPECMSNVKKTKCKVINDVSYQNPHHRSSTTVLSMDNYPYPIAFECVEE